jgi:hypothetical protein
MADLLLETESAVDLYGLNSSAQYNAEDLENNLIQDKNNRA